jgi:hypothetical protein
LLSFMPLNTTIFKTVKDLSSIVRIQFLRMIYVFHMIVILVFSIPKACFNCSNNMVCSIDKCIFPLQVGNSTLKFLDCNNCIKGCGSLDMVFGLVMKLMIFRSFFKYFQYFYSSMNETEIINIHPSASASHPKHLHFNHLLVILLIIIV